MTKLDDPGRNGLPARLPVTSDERADLLVSLAQLEALVALPSTSAIGHWSHAISIPSHRAFGRLLGAIQQQHTASIRQELWSALARTLEDEGIRVWLEAVPSGVEASVRAESARALPRSRTYKFILVRVKPLSRPEPYLIEKMYRGEE